jgi:hypothetical protein
MCLQRTMCVLSMHRYSELPWRNPLETNNISYEAYDSRMRVPRILYISLSLHHKMESRMANIMSVYINDPSAGSPTETLLRLLVPPNHQV